jgi:hypothetical protein
MPSAAAQHQESALAAARPWSEAVALAEAVTGVSGSLHRASIVDGLAQCLSSVSKSQWPQIAGRFSGLTADGSPLEFTFSTADIMLRYTVEVAPPELPNQARLQAAVHLSSEIGLDFPKDDSLERWSHMQRDQPLRWGARLGVRETFAGCQAKLYIEVPSTYASPLSHGMTPPIEGSIPVMIGVSPHGGKTEVYFRQQLLSPQQLNCVLATVAEPQERERWLEGIRQMCGMPISSALRWMSFGYSVSIGPGMVSPQLSLFVRSQAIGGSVKARRILLDRMAAGIRERSLYYKLLAGLAPAQLPDHGVLSIACAASQEMEFRCGLSSAALIRLLHCVAGRDQE